MRPWLWGVLNGSANLFCVQLSAELYSRGELLLASLGFLASACILGLSTWLCEATQQRYIESQRDRIREIEEMNSKWKEICQLYKGS